jgi:molybdenum cofactor cytidylyltransferase
MKIIYLAAGNSRRFGSQKLFYKLHGKCLYQHGLDILKQLIQKRNDCTLLVVYQDPRIAKENPELDTINSPDSKKGISYSICAGLEGVDEDVMFVVADQPGIRVDTLNAFVDSFYKSGKNCGSLRYDGVPGNPTIFKKQLIPKLRQLEEDQGGRTVLKREDCFYYDIENPGELKDIDRKEDIPDFSLFPKTRL